MIGDDKLEAARQMLLAHDDTSPAEELLYSSWYHAIDERMREYPTASAYLAAILDPTRFEGGWRVEETGLEGQAGSAEIIRDGERRVAAPPLVTPAMPEMLLFEPGAEVLAFPFHAAEGGGFWHIASPLWERDGLPAERQRLYFALAEGSECSFARTFGANADPASSWSMKMLCGRQPAGRRDQAVAYLPAALDIRDGWASRLLTALAPFLIGEGPTGTRALAPGIAWAPDLESERSFGQLLCSAVAEVPDDLSDPEGWIAAARRRTLPLLASAP